MIHPDPDLADEGPKPHEISEPPLPLSPPPRASHHPFGPRLLTPWPPHHFLLLQASAPRRAASSSPLRLTEPTAPRHVRKSPHRRHCPCPAPHRLPPCPRGRGRSTFLPRSVPSGDAVERPCLDRGLVTQHRSTAHSSRTQSLPRAPRRPHRLRNPFLTNDADLLMRQGTPVAGSLTVALPDLPLCTAQHTTSSLQPDDDSHQTRYLSTDWPVGRPIVESLLLTGYCQTQTFPGLPPVQQPPSFSLQPPAFALRQ